MKKKTLRKMADEGVLTIPLEDDGIRLKAEHFEVSHPDTLYQIADSEATGWDLYNSLTNTASHDTRSVNSQYWADTLVSNLFNL
jgi:hypothetical protein